MAGMFYSLEEAADKLGMTQEEIKQLATEGKLREFRDGSNIMFKIDEVESLLTSEGGEQIEDLDLALEPVSEADGIDELLELEPKDEEVLDAPDDQLLEPVEEEAEVDELASLEEDALTLESDMDEPNAENLDEDLDALLGFADEGDASEESPIDDDDLSLLLGGESDDLDLGEPEIDMTTSEVDDDLGLDPSDTQVVADEPELGIADDAAHVNPNGGAIALGHPLGMSGARLALTAAYQLKLTGGRYALCTMCVGVGQGVAMILERV